VGPRRWGTLWALLHCACVVDIDYSSARFSCRDGVCPSGFVCHLEQCLPEGEAAPAADVDASPVPMSENTPDAAAPATRPCEGGDQAFIEAGRCHVMFLTPDLWESAMATCAAEGAHLVTVGSADETAMLAPHLGLEEWWMGASDAAVEGEWLWYDGAPMTYTNWRTGEPNNAGVAGEDCGILEGHNAGLWDDRACDSSFPFFCVRD
jgi:hypothetical protein